MRDYPPYRTPHPGDPRQLTLQQCEENLRYLLEQRPHRLQALAQLLQGFDIDLDAGLRAADVRPFLGELDRWASATWPALHTPSAARLVDPRVWLTAPKDGDNIVLSMLMDVGIALGEIVVARRAEFAWRLDLDPDNEADGMLSYRRPVVMRPPIRDGTWAATVLDFEAICIGRFEAAGRTAPPSHRLGFAVTATLDGGYDPPD